MCAEHHQRSAQGREAHAQSAARFVDYCQGRGRRLSRYQFNQTASCEIYGHAVDRGCGLNADEELEKTRVWKTMPTTLPDGIISQWKVCCGICNKPWFCSYCDSCRVNKSLQRYWTREHLYYLNLSLDILSFNVILQFTARDFNARIKRLCDGKNNDNIRPSQKI